MITQADIRQDVRESLIATCHLVLASHVGKDNAISNRELADMIGTDKRTVRQLILDLRLRGHAICSLRKGTGGYFLPAGPEDMDACLHEFESFWRTSLTIWARMRRMKMHDIIRKIQTELPID